jgi:hypothetical protein
MKILLSKESIPTIALLMLLSLHAFTSMTIFVNATIIKSPTVYINGSGSLELTWKSGKSQTYGSDAYANLGGLDTINIIPNHGWHIDTVLIDENPQAILDEDGFRLINVQAKNMVSATFLENGGVDDVDTGSNVEAYPDPYVGLIFTDVGGEGWAYAIPTALQPPEAKGESWDIQTTAYFVGDVTVILVLNLADLPDGFDPYRLTLLRTEVELARSDVNSDGMVNGTDVSIVANANPSKLGDPKYDPKLDLNDNGVIDDKDVNIVNNYIGEPVWEDITLQVIVANGIIYVYGLTDHFSIFGVH